ncbi:MAG: transcriptional repressor LexA, partial [Bacteroidetes bacterium]|nr:transcriptional repressor LexA [Bacteroidota bacterium]
MKSELTEKQQRILDFIDQFIVDHGYPPTIMEMAERFKVTIGTIQDHIEALKRKSYLRQRPNKARGFELAFKSQGIPIYGRVAAGRPIFAVENILGYLGEDKNDHEVFALKVVGDSMVDAGIVEGDVLKVRKQQTADDKDIVIALLGDEVTVKRFRRKYGKQYLEPANPAYAVIKDVSFEILGK